MQIRRQEMEIKIARRRGAFNSQLSAQVYHRGYSQITCYQEVLIAPDAFFYTWEPGDHDERRCATSTSSGRRVPH